MDDDDNERLWQGNAMKVLIYLVSSVDHVSPVTGGTVTMKISKDGGSFADPSDASVIEIGYGFYVGTLNASDADTRGQLLVIATASGADQFHKVISIE